MKFRLAYQFSLVPRPEETSSDLGTRQAWCVRARGKLIPRGKLSIIQSFKEMELPDIPGIRHQPDGFAFVKRLVVSFMRFFFPAPSFKELGDWMPPKEMKGS